MGCLRTLFVQVGCLVVLVAAAVLGFIYREQVVAVYRRLRGLPPVAEAVFVGPAPGGADRATAALERLVRPGGPAYVDVGAAELAALVDAELARTPRRVFDSVAVALGEDEVMVRGVLDLSGVPRQLLGPLASGFSPREPVVAGGPLAVDSAGTARWEIRSLRVRDFPFPRGTVPAIVRALRLPGGRDGALPLPTPGPIGDVRVSAAGVRLYRAAPR